MRTILIILLVVVLYRTFVRYILPAIIVNFIQNSQQRFNQQYNNPPVNRQEGEIKVDYIPPSNKGENSDRSGDYVDYEEVK